MYKEFGCFTFENATTYCYIKMTDGRWYPHDEAGRLLPEAVAYDEIQDHYYGPAKIRLGGLWGLMGEFRGLVTVTDCCYSHIRLPRGPQDLTVCFRKNAEGTEAVDIYDGREIFRDVGYRGGRGLEGYLAAMYRADGTFDVVRFAAGCQNLKVLLPHLPTDKTLIIDEGGSAQHK